MPAMRYTHTSLLLRMRWPSAVCTGGRLASLSPLSSRCCLSASCNSSSRRASHRARVKLNVRDVSLLKRVFHPLARTSLLPQMDAPRLPLVFSAALELWRIHSLSVPSSSLALTVSVAPTGCRAASGIRVARRSRGRVQCSQHLSSRLNLGACEGHKRRMVNPLRSNYLHFSQNLSTLSPSRARWLTP